MPEGTRAMTPEERDFYTKLGGRLEKRRKLLGMTLKEAAEKVGIRYQQVQKYETGDNRISLWRLYQYAPALDIAPEELIRGLVFPADKTPNGET